MKKEPTCEEKLALALAQVFMHLTSSRAPRQSLLCSTSDILRNISISEWASNRCELRLKTPMLTVCISQVLREFQDTLQGIILSSFLAPVGLRKLIAFWQLQVRRLICCILHLQLAVFADNVWRLACSPRLGCRTWQSIFIVQRPSTL
jgi:hypothetical protein